MRSGSPGMLIVGLGETGASVARFFQKRSVPFVVADSRQSPPGYREFKSLYPGVDVRLGDFDRSFFLDVDGIVVSPGVPLGTPAIRGALAKGIPVIGDVELFARTLAEDRASPNATVMAITGSNGKSTVTALVSDMAVRAGIKVATGGNCSPPALDLIDADADCYILELSSFQLESTYSLKPAASTILNVSEDHLDRYASFSDYVKAKQRVYERSKMIVFNRRERHLFDFDQPSKSISFGLDAPDDGHFGIVENHRGGAIFYGSQPWIDCNELGYLPGNSGKLNAQAALALGDAIGIPRQRMDESLRNFRGLPHRFQALGTIGGTVWINDSKATNVAAAAEALASVTQPCVWIAGGDGKGANFQPLREAVNGRVHTALLLGVDAPGIAAAISDVVADIRIVNDLEEAVNEAHAASRNSGCVLLSPACASTDMFDDYRERGACFARAFREIRGDEKHTAEAD